MSGRLCIANNFKDVIIFEPCQRYELHVMVTQNVDDIVEVEAIRVHLVMTQVKEPVAILSGTDV